MVCNPVPYHILIGTDGLILPHKGDFQRLSKDPFTQRRGSQEFSGSLVVTSWNFPCGGPGSVPGQGDLKSHTLWGCSQKNKKKQLKKKTRGALMEKFQLLEQVIDGVVISGKISRWTHVF